MTSVNSKQDFQVILSDLVSRFDDRVDHYLSRDYSEAQVRLDFIDPLFEALGWDIRNLQGLGPREREVIIEKGRTVGRPDYNFRRDGKTIFFVEAKAPHVSLESTDVVMQAKSYAWSSLDVFVCVVIDFEEIRVFDCVFRTIPSTDSDEIRPPNPAQTVHRFRNKSSTDSSIFRPLRLGRSESKVSIYG